MNIEQAYRQLPLSRKRAIQYGLPVAGLAALALTRCETPEQRVASSFKEMHGLIKQGADMRTAVDTEAVFRTRAGVDLPFSRLATSERIRRIQDPVQRVMAAIGYLSVQDPNNKRYDIRDAGACNVYALDLLRLVLGNGAIGSRYSVDDGSPQVFGIKDIDWTDISVVRDIDSINPYLGAFNLDNWMRIHGPRYGWQHVKSPTELDKLMHSKEYIALGVSTDERIQARVAGEGHAYVLTYGEKPGYGVTQATTHITYGWVAQDDHKATPGLTYNIHAHRLTDFRN